MKKIFLIFIILSILLVSCGNYLEESEVDIIATIANNAYNRYKTEVNSTEVVETSTIQPTQLIPTNTATPSKTNTLMPTPTNTVVSTNTKTAIYTKTKTPTRTPTKTFTITLTPTLTFTPTYTHTAILPTTTTPLTITPTTTSSGNTYHVYAGSSIQTTINKMSAGDTLYIHSGTYQQLVNISVSGVTVLGYPENSVIIDDNYGTVVGTWGALFKVTGSNNIIKNIEVKRSNYMGVLISGTNNIVDNFYSHLNMENGIIITGNYSTVQNSDISYNCMSNENGIQTRSGWASGLSAARSPIGAMIKNNIVYNNWGEGISTYEATYTTIEDNIAYDNWSTNIYVSDTTDTLISGNFIYNTQSWVNGARVGIMTGDEEYNPRSARVIIINNIVYGCDRNFYWWENTSGYGMINFYIANNTFVNSRETNNIQINSSNHTDSYFINNIIVQEDSLTISLLYGTGITYDYNLWSDVPSSIASGGNNIIGDSKFSKTNNVYSNQYYILLSSSDAIDVALSIPYVTDDYFNYIRDNLPDIGAIEYH
jgi:parallel beta-helix repeat protein